VLDGWFYLSMAPWLLFVVSDRSSGIGPLASGLLAAAVGSVLVVVGLQIGKPRVLPCVATATFSSLALVAWLGRGTSVGARFDRPLATGVLSLTFAISILFSPLTSHATEIGFAGARLGPARLRYHRTLTAWWAVSLALSALSGSVAVELQTAWASTVFNWILPMSAISAVAFACSASSDQPTEDDDLELSAVLGALGGGRSTAAHGSDEARLRLLPTGSDTSQNAS
jgi:hypothetical protein